MSAASAPAPAPACCCARSSRATASPSWRTGAAGDLARGPGRLATAFGIDRSLDGVDLCAAGALWLAAPLRATGPIGDSVRIGLTVEADRVLRFYERGS